MASSTLRTATPQRMGEARDILSGVDWSDHHKVAPLIQDIERFVKEWQRLEYPKIDTGQGPVGLSRQMPDFHPGSPLWQAAEDIINSLKRMIREEEALERQSPTTSRKIKGFGEGVKDKSKEDSVESGEREG